jgi:NAD(P)-dependent dehydrogenase (short-subunit alcohol dehydrogenase family)
VKNLRGKIAVVTGAGSGIGRALAGELARQGCHVALADVSEAGLAGTLDRLRGLPVNVTTHLVDVANRPEVEALAADVVERHGAAHILVNNAGVAVAERAENIPYEDFEWLMGINFWGVVYGCTAFLPHLRAAGEGHIVNVSSVFGLISVPTQAAYNASKFAVRGYTEALGQELAGSRISVSCVCPGGIRTAIVRNARVPDASGTMPDKKELAGTFENLARTSAEEAGSTIVRGIIENRKRILIGPDARLISLIVRLFPVSYPAFLKRLLPAPGINQ